MPRLSAPPVQGQIEKKKPYLFYEEEEETPAEIVRPVEERS